MDPDEKVDTTPHSLWRRHLKRRSPHVENETVVVVGVATVNPLHVGSCLLRVDRQGGVGGE